MVEHPVQLGEQRPGPDGALGHLHAEHPLDGQHHAQFVGERRQPVVAVGQHHDLPVVARLEELLRAAVHIADDRLGLPDHLAVEHQTQPEHAVRRRVLRPMLSTMSVLSAAPPMPTVVRVVSVMGDSVSEPVGPTRCGAPGLPGSGRIPRTRGQRRAVGDADRLHQPAEVAETAARRQLRRLPGRRQRPHVRRGIGGGQRQRRARPAHPQAGAAPRAGESSSAPGSAQASSATWAVRSQLPSGTGRTSRPVPEAGERTEGRPGVRVRARSRPPPRARAPAKRRPTPRPRRGAGRSPRGCRGRPAATSAPATAASGPSTGSPNSSVPSARTRTYRAGPRQLIGLGDVDRHVVQPFVREEQPADPGRRSARHSIRGSRPGGRGARSTAYGCTVRPSGSRSSTPVSSSPRPAPTSTNVTSSVSSAAAVRISSRATAAANSGEACTEVRKCAGGALRAADRSRRGRRARPPPPPATAVAGARPWPVAGPGLRDPRASSVTASSLHLGEYASADRIDPPVDPSAFSASLRWVTCSASTTSSADIRRASTASGLSCSSGSRCCGRFSQYAGALPRLAAIGIVLLLSVMVALRRRAPEKTLLLVGVAGRRPARAGRPGQSRRLRHADRHLHRGRARADRAGPPELALVGGLFAAPLAQIRWPADQNSTIGQIFVTVVLSVPFLLAWVLGDSIRTRRAYFDQLEERASRLEKEREAQAKVAVAAERARIARELHDVVAHNVSVMVVQADGAAYVLDGAPDQAKQALETISSTGRQALAEMRRLLGVLRTGDTRESGEYVPQPDVEQIEELVEQVRSAGLTVDFKIEGTPRPLAERRRTDRVPHRAGGTHQQPQARRTRCRRQRATGLLRRRARTARRGRRPRSGARPPRGRRGRRTRSRSHRYAGAGRYGRRHPGRRAPRRRRFPDQCTAPAEICALSPRTRAGAVDRHRLAPPEHRTRTGRTRATGRPGRWPHTALAIHSSAIHSP